MALTAVILWLMAEAAAAVALTPTATQRQVVAMTQMAIRCQQAPALVALTRTAIQRQVVAMTRMAIRCQQAVESRAVTTRTAIQKWVVGTTRMARLFLPAQGLVGLTRTGTQRRQVDTMLAATQFQRVVLQRRDSPACPTLAPALDLDLMADSVATAAKVAKVAKGKERRTGQRIWTSSSSQRSAFLAGWRLAIPWWLHLAEAALKRRSPGCAMGM